MQQTVRTIYSTHLWLLAFILVHRPADAGLAVPSTQQGQRGPAGSRVIHHTRQRHHRHQRAALGCGGGQAGLGVHQQRLRRGHMAKRRARSDLC